tara:strand:+ start:599 stop:1543 length:945 start_codon:yes stop_codon:yes gene_type:complete
MSKLKKNSDLSIGEIRELNKDRPRSPMYNAIDLVIDDITPFVEKNFDLCKNIYPLAAANFFYLAKCCKNFLEYFKDETLIINHGDRIERIKPSEIPGDPEEYIKKALSNPKLMYSEIVNFECIINDSFYMLKEFNGDVSCEYIRDYYIEKYNIDPKDLKETPYNHSLSFSKRRRVSEISFEDIVPYGPIKIKNQNKDYNIDFFTKSIKHLSTLLDIPKDLSDRMIRKILNPYYKVSWGYKNRLSEVLIVTTDRNGKRIGMIDATDSALYYTIANAIGRFFFYGWDTDDNSEYMKIRRELEPYYLRYLEKRSKAA